MSSDQAIVNSEVKRAPTRIRSVSRAVEILKAVVDAEDGVTGTGVASKLGLPPPTAFHLLSTLVDGGVLAKHDRRYYLGPACGQIADAFLRQHFVPPYLLSPLHKLVAETMETAYLSAWRHGEIVVLASVEGQLAVRVGGPHSGFFGQAHARASGKVLLAVLDNAALEMYLASHPLEPLTNTTITDKRALCDELATVRERGSATDREEFKEGVSCVSVAVADGQGFVLGAYTVAAPSQRFDSEHDNYVEALRRAADAATGIATEPDEDG